MIYYLLKGECKLIQSVNGVVTVNLCPLKKPNLAEYTYLVLNYYRWT